MLAQKLLNSLLISEISYCPEVSVRIGQSSFLIAHRFFRHLNLIAVMYQVRLPILRPVSHQLNSSDIRKPGQRSITHLLPDPVYITDTSVITEHQRERRICKRPVHLLDFPQRFQAVISRLETRRDSLPLINGNISWARQILIFVFSLFFLCSI